MSTHTAAFRPRRRDNLRPELVPLIGATTTWRYAGTSEDDEPYPGQTRWNTDDPRFLGYWCPAEDLEPRPTYRPDYLEAEPD